VEDLGWTLIVAVGVVAGAINTLVGGGTMLVLPLLIFLGIDPLVANGTNRVCVAFQALVAGWTLHRGRQSRQEESRQEEGGEPSTSSEGVDSSSASVQWLALLVVGLASVPGAWGAIALDEASKEMFRTLMGSGLIVAVGAFLMPRPASPQGKKRVGGAGAGFFVGCFLCGMYGGFVGAGVGAFIVMLLTSSRGMSVLDAVRWKVWWVAAMSAVAGAWYLSQGVFDPQVALALLPSYGVGAHIGSRIAMSGGDRRLRPIVAVVSMAMAAYILLTPAN